MVKYYYDKFNTQNMWLDTAPWAYGGGASIRFASYYKSHNLTQSNTYTTAGHNLWGTNETLKAGDACYSASGGNAFRYVAHSGGGIGGSSVNTDSYVKYASNNSQQPYRGTLVTANIIAEDGTYPVDGRHSDGFWYARKTVAIVAPSISINIDGVQRAYDEGWVNIDGVWRVIDAVYVNIEGVWRIS